MNPRKFNIKVSGSLGGEVSGEFNIKVSREVCPRLLPDFQRNS